MESPTYMPLQKIYSREEDFSKALSQNLSLLEIGNYEDSSEVDALVGTRRADIVACGNDGTVVIECQFDRADWDHWGRNIGKNPKQVVRGWPDGLLEDLGFTIIRTASLNDGAQSVNLLLS